MATSEDTRIGYVRNVTARQDGQYLVIVEVLKPKLRVGVTMAYDPNVGASIRIRGRGAHWRTV